MEYEIDVVLKILDDVIVAFKEGYVAVVNIIVRLIVFFYAYVDVVFIDDLNVVHVFVDYVLVYFPDFFTKVQEIFVVTVSYVLNLSAVKQQLPNRRESLQPIFVYVQFF